MKMQILKDFFLSLLPVTLDVISKSNYSVFSYVSEILNCLFIVVGSDLIVFFIIRQSGKNWKTLSRHKCIVIVSPTWSTSDYSKLSGFFRTQSMILFRIKIFNQPCFHFILDNSALPLNLKTKATKCLLIILKKTEGIMTPSFLIMAYRLFSFY